MICCSFALIFKQSFRLIIGEFYFFVKMTPHIMTLYQLLPIRMHKEGESMTSDLYSFAEHPAPYFLLISLRPATHSSDLQLTQVMGVISGDNESTQWFKDNNLVPKMSRTRDRTIDFTVIKHLIISRNCVEKVTDVQFLGFYNNKSLNVWLRRQSRDLTSSGSS